jgi:hypothetical protein
MLGHKDCSSCIIILLFYFKWNAIGFCWIVNDNGFPKYGDHFTGLRDLMNK